MSGYQFDRLRILIVDDNPHMRKLICVVLQAFGVVHILESANGEDALSKLRTNPCDIVLLDWVMPGMSGLNLARCIRDTEKSPNPFLPIIILSGHTAIEHVRAARDAGINEFLAKPISAKTLLSRLQSIIEYPRPFIKTGVYFGPCRRRRRDTPYMGAERRTDEANLDAA